jgi:hypothetical protein
VNEYYIVLKREYIYSSYVLEDTVNKKKIMCPGNNATDAQFTILISTFEKKVQTLYFNCSLLDDGCKVIHGYQKVFS